MTISFVLIHCIVLHGVIYPSVQLHMVHLNDNWGEPERAGHINVKYSERVYIYIYIYIYIPPPPPPHSASYNIMTTTTSARRVSALVGHRKRPPVQVTAEPGQHQHHSNHHICHRVNALDG